MIQLAVWLAVVVVVLLLLLFASYLEGAPMRKLMREADAIDARYAALAKRQRELATQLDRLERLTGFAERRH